MSTDIYAKFISEQINKEKVRGLRNGSLREELELTLEDYVDMLEAYIENLESHFETEDLQQIQELSKKTLRSFVDKRASQRDLASHDIVRKNIAAASGVKPRNKPESAASTRSYHRAINKIVKDKDSPDRPKVLGTGD